MVGQDGVHGRLVVSLVEPVLRNVLGTVRSQRPVTAGKIVKEKRGKDISVAHILARVRTSSVFSFRIRLFIFWKILYFQCLTANLSFCC